ALSSEKFCNALTHGPVDTLPLVPASPDTKPAGGADSLRTLPVPRVDHRYETTGPSPADLLTPGADTLPPSADTIVFSKDSIDAPIHYSAQDSIVFILPEKKILLYTGATVRQKDMELVSDTIEIDQSVNLVTARSKRDSTGLIV